MAAFLKQLQAYCSCPMRIMPVDTARALMQHRGDGGGALPCIRYIKHDSIFHIIWSHVNAAAAGDAPSPNITIAMAAAHTKLRMAAELLLEQAMYCTLCVCVCVMCVFNEIYTGFYRPVLSTSQFI